MSAGNHAFLPCWYATSTSGIVRYNLQGHRVLRRMCVRCICICRSRVLLWWHVLYSSCLVNAFTVGGGTHHFCTAVMNCVKRTDICPQQRVMNDFLLGFAVIYTIHCGFHHEVSSVSTGVSETTFFFLPSPIRPSKSFTRLESCVSIPQTETVDTHTATDIYGRHSHQLSTSTFSSGAMCVEYPD